MRPESALAALLDTGTHVITHAADSGTLSPWITWPTLHRGVSNELHCISDFGEDLSEIDQEYPPIWQLLGSQGVRVGMFGSLHTYPLPTNVTEYAFYVPDTFAAGPETFPEDIQCFQNFNLMMVDGSGRNVSSSIPIKPALELVLRAPLLAA